LKTKLWAWIYYQENGCASWWLLHEIYHKGCGFIRSRSTQTDFLFLLPTTWCHNTWYQIFYQSMYSFQVITFPSLYNILMLNHCLSHFKQAAVIVFHSHILLFIPNRLPLWFFSTTNCKHIRTSFILSIKLHKAVNLSNLIVSLSTMYFFGTYCPELDPLFSLFGRVPFKVPESL